MNYEQYRTQSAASRGTPGLPAPRIYEERCMKLHARHKRAAISLTKFLIIFLFPAVLTYFVNHDKRVTYEFVDEDNKRMVIPSAPHPYLSQLFEDAFLSMGMNWYSFCIENNSFSKEHSLRFDLKVKLEHMDDIQIIHFGESKCFPVLREDVFYVVAWGGFVIPDSEWVAKHFELIDNNFEITFPIGDMVNFDVYRKLSISAIATVYALLVAGFFGFLKLSISIYRFMFTKHRKI